MGYLLGSAPVVCQDIDTASKHGRGQRIDPRNCREASTRMIPRVPTRFRTATLSPGDTPMKALGSPKFARQAIKRLHEAFCPCLGRGGLSSDPPTNTQERFQVQHHRYRAVYCFVSTRSILLVVNPENTTNKWWACKTGVKRPKLTSISRRALQTLLHRRFIALGAGRRRSPKASASP